MKGLLGLWTLCLLLPVGAGAQPNFDGAPLRSATDVQAPRSPEGGTPGRSPRRQKPRRPAARTPKRRPGPDRKKKRAPEPVDPEEGAPRDDGDGPDDNDERSDSTDPGRPNDPEGGSPTHRRPR